MVANALPAEIEVVPRKVPASIECSKCSQRFVSLEIVSGVFGYKRCKCGNTQFNWLRRAWAW